MKFEIKITLPFIEICMQVKKQQLKPDMEQQQQTGSKLGKEYVKAVYCHLAFLTFMIESIIHFRLIFKPGYGTTDWFQIGKGVCQGCILSPCLFNLCAEYIMHNAGWMKCKLELRLLGEISITSDMQMTHPENGTYF